MTRRLDEKVRRLEGEVLVPAEKQAAASIVEHARRVLAITPDAGPLRFGPTAHWAERLLAGEVRPVLFVGKRAGIRHQIDAMVAEMYRRAYYRAFVARDAEIADEGMGC